VRYLAQFADRKYFVRANTPSSTCVSAASAVGNLRCLDFSLLFDDRGADVLNAIANVVERPRIKRHRDYSSAIFKTHYSLGRQ
jgi:hypothetical protein